MTRLAEMLRTLITRWSRQQETALRQMSRRKTVRGRLGGLAKSERVEAKFFLLALAPFAPLMMSDALDWSRGLLWEVWFWLSALWAAVIFGFCLAACWRAMRAASQRDV